MVIRSWTERDLPEVLALLAGLAGRLGEPFRADLDRARRQFRSMKRRPETYEAFVAEEDGRVLGFASILFYESVFHRKGTALVNELVVAEGKRGAGIGRCLMERVVEEAEIREMDEVEVGVLKDNEDAIRFYKANGLVEEYLLLGVELDGD